MKIAAAFAGALFVAAAGLSFAEENVEAHGRRAAAPEKPEWEFVATAYGNAPRGSDDFASGIAAADRGPLHLEFRANYEAIHAQSAFIGWTFSGEAGGMKLEATPIVGGATGSIGGPIAGVEAAVAMGKFDFYIEAEYVRGRGTREESYTYAWSELGYTPMEKLRLGIVAQRTRLYGGDRDVQRGGFVQATWGPALFGVYWFNPGSSDQVVIGSVGFSF
jgi:hypothetical protein